ncbi:hypothetical protein Syun_029673 [Stephania yunnanensis]|uniref:Uncharacterized protein n=1 Tax=Stephania yunnanensis TaxID=152371 RepID=A0AAP0EEA0_9MAGN
MLKLFSFPSDYNATLVKEFYADFYLSCDQALSIGVDPILDSWGLQTPKTIAYFLGHGLCPEAQVTR